MWAEFVVGSLLLLWEVFLHVSLHFSPLPKQLSGWATSESLFIYRPNCDSDGKADNKRQAFINTDTRRFKIQMGDMGPPPPPLAGPLPELPITTMEILIPSIICNVISFSVQGQLCAGWRNLSNYTRTSMVCFLCMPQLWNVIFCIG